MRSFRLAVAAFVASITIGTAWAQGDPLPGTLALQMEGDIASAMVNGIDRFLLRQLDTAAEHRKSFSSRNWNDPAADQDFVDSQRMLLQSILGITAERPTTEIRLDQSLNRPARIASSESVDVFAVSWPAFADVTGTGLLLVPRNQTRPLAIVVAIPDCDQSPEQLIGLLDGVPAESQFARHLAESGCLVLVPALIDRTDHLPQLTRREWLYRSAFELGHSLVGYEVQKVRAAVSGLQAAQLGETPIGMIGWGEGGLIALYASAIDSRIQSTVVSGYFEPRQKTWQQPIDRNLFGLLKSFGDAEIASLIAPRTLMIEACRGPERDFPGGRGAPATLRTPELADVQVEFGRLQRLTEGLPTEQQPRLLVNDDGHGEYACDATLQAFLQSLDRELSLKTDSEPFVVERELDAEARIALQVHELDRHNQAILRQSHKVRQQQTMARFDFSSLQAYEGTASDLREEFYRDVIGKFDQPLLTANPRSRQFMATERWTGYEVVLDVFPDVIAYGLLLLPNDIQPDDRRPLVVCQHGLEGRPQDTIGEQGFTAYQAFAARLADRGYVVFAPQNPYIFGDRFRTLQRKANPLGKTLFSIITPQHQQIVDWLQTQPFVDPDRIGFYGLSYGGKTAMRVPAIVTDYCLSICSADFNEWVDKNASTSNPRSYVNMGEYEIFEFNLGGTFNYAEMAALIAPRPFMVERGHADGVADDWTVGWEYAKVRHLYGHRLKIPERTEIEWFDGPHTIHGQATFEFLARHLAWPAGSGR